MRAKVSNEYRFGGHQTFAVRIAWLPKAAAAIEAGRDPFTNPLDGIVELGLGKNMVEALRCWVEAYGVAEKVEQRLRLTALGREVFGSGGHDPFLEDDQTLWLLHWNIATLRKAPFYAWELLFNRWNEPGFSPSLVLQAFKEEAARAERPLSPVSARQHFDVFMHTYVTGRGRNEDGLDSPLSSIRLIQRAGEREQSNGKLEPVFAFDLQRKSTIGQELFEYCIHEWWDAEFEFEETVALREIAFGRGGPGRIFRMPESEVKDRLEMFHRSKSGSLDLIESLNQLVVRRRHRPDRLKLLSAIYGDGMRIKEYAYA